MIITKITLNLFKIRNNKQFFILLTRDNIFQRFLKLRNCNNLKKIFLKLKDKKTFIILKNNNNKCNNNRYNNNNFYHSKIVVIRSNLWIKLLKNKLEAY